MTFDAERLREAVQAAYDELTKRAEMCLAVGKLHPEAADRVEAMAACYDFAAMQLHAALNPERS